MTLSIMSFNISNKCHYAECLVVFNGILNSIMLNVIMLNVIMLIVVMLSVMAPEKCSTKTSQGVTNFNKSLRDKRSSLLLKRLWLYKGQRSISAKNTLAYYWSKMVNYTKKVLQYWPKNKNETKKICRNFFPPRFF